MSNTKSRNFRRRAGDDYDDEENSSTPITTKANATASTTSKPQSRPTTANKSKKPPSQPPKSLLSFANDDDDPHFSSSSSKPTSSRLNKSSSSSSTHKITLAKDRNVPKIPSSLLPSNVQPQAGTYTKETLLELQKNTRTLAAPSRTSAQTQTKPGPGSVIVLKGPLKPQISADPYVEVIKKPQDFVSNEMDVDQKGEILNVERDDAVTRLGTIGLGSGSKDVEPVIPDQAMIDAIRAKRERLRQVKAATPDYIALDGGNDHGEAEGMSDEEPEFQGRIGFFGEKIDSNKKGVFDNYEERAMPKDRGIGSAGDDEDEEDKMWEEEQVRKGLGKRMDDGVGSKGAGGTVNSANSVSQVAQQPSFGYLATGTCSVYSSVQTVGGGSSYSSIIGGAVGELLGSDVIPVAQQSELAKKALYENLKRLKESHGQMIVSLTKADENLSASLENITTLENSLSAAGEKFIFMQKLRDFVSVICDFLQHKAPFIEELEEQMQQLHEKRAAATIERRDADNEDEMLELEPAINAARAVFSKGGSNAVMIEEATAAAAKALSAIKLKDLPVELDEFGRDVNLQKRMDIVRRQEVRERRITKADSKRMSAMKSDDSYQQMEGESSTDDSDSESTGYESTRNQLLQVAEKIFSDAAEDYSELSVVIGTFERWKKNYASSYRDAYMSLSIPAIFSPYVRVELLMWDPLHKDADFIDMKWHSLLFNYGLPEDEREVSPDVADADANLIPELVEKLAIPILHHQLAYCLDMLSTRETKHAVYAMNLVFRYVPLSSKALGKLVAVLHERLTDAVTNLTVPTWSPLEMKVVPNAARVAAYRFGTSVRLMRNICLWNKILAKSVLEKLALDELLSGKVLPHLRSIRTTVHDAISRTERIIASLHGVWAGSSVTGDRSPKLQQLVDYLVLIGKMVEKKQASGSTEHARRLKKMLVELNEYDHARALSRTFNLKEAL